MSKGKEVKSDNKLLFLGMAAVLMVFGFISVNSKTKRNQIEEIKKLPFHNVAIETVEDGVYNGETATSFLYIVLNVEVENHKLKNIQFEKMNGKKIEHLEEIAQRMIEANSIKIEAKRGQELETLVLMSCVDSAIYKVDGNEELKESNAEN